MTKKETEHRGMGKKIYEIALRGAYEFNKKYPGTRAMCVIDCRNKNSLRALATAVENINETTFNGENKELPANIVGYYELVDNKDNPIEAPTLVLEVGLEEQTISDKNELKIKYNTSDTCQRQILKQIKEQLDEKLEAYKDGEPIDGQDGENTVRYYILEGRPIEGVQVNPNGTEKGNNRNPNKKQFMKDFVGPIRPIYLRNTDGVQPTDGKQQTGGDAR